jgi:hypothetical protein
MHTITSVSESEFKHRSCLLGLGVFVLLGLAILLLPSLFMRCEGPYARDLSPETLDPDEIDTSLLTGEPCESPCWHGITPGLTTDEEMVAILEELPFFEADTLRRKAESVITFDREREVIYWGHGTTFFMLLDDVVTTIDVGLYYDVELHDLIERLGEPTGYFAYTYPPPDAIRIGPGCVEAEVQYVWSEHGLMAVTSFETRDPPHRSGKLFSGADRLYIHDVTYSPPASSVLEYLVARGRYESSAEKDIEWYYQPWLGDDRITLPAYYQD